MIPVYQNQFGFGKGNCAWACIASVFEVPLDTLPSEPPYTEDWRTWTRENMPHLEMHNVDLGYNYRIVDGFPDCEGVGTGRWTYDVRDSWEPPDASATDGYWIATVPSQRLKTPVESPWYPMPALHAVVFRDDVCVHNPNPNNYLDPQPQVIMQTWWTLDNEADLT